MSDLKTTGSTAQQVRPSGAQYQSRDSMAPLYIRETRLSYDRALSDVHASRPVSCAAHHGPRQAGRCRARPFNSAGERKEQLHARSSRQPTSVPPATHRCRAASFSLRFTCCFTSAHASQALREEEAEKAARKKHKHEEGEHCRCRHHLSPLALQPPWPPVRPACSWSMIHHHLRQPAPTSLRSRCPQGSQEGQDAGPDRV